MLQKTTLKKMLTILSVFLFAISIYGQKTLVSDPPHSRIQFTVTHLGINDITGNLNSVEMRLNQDESNFLNSKLSFRGDVNSINTNIEARDNHLKSADFFDVANHPTMEFVSTSLTKGKQKNYYQLNGNLTIRGITKPITLMLIYRGSAVNEMNNKKTYAYQVLGTLKRMDYNVGSKFGETMVSNLIRIKGDFELLEQ